MSPRLIIVQYFKYLLFVYYSTLVIGYISVAKATYHPFSPSVFSLHSTANIQHKFSTKTSKYNNTSNHENQDLILYQNLISCEDPSLSAAINSSLSILQDAFRLYGPSNVVASYNGGKDADVVMNLMRAAMAKYSYDSKKNYTSKFIYFAIKDEFPEVIEHIEHQEESLQLDVLRSNLGIVQADSIARYSPAYTLKDWGLERAGRSPTTPKKTNPNPDRSTEGCDLKEKPESMMQQ